MRRRSFCGVALKFCCIQGALNNTKTGRTKRPAYIFLHENIIGLEGIRFIEDDGVHIHYSTYKSDVLTENDSLVSYKNYVYVNIIQLDGKSIDF